MTCKALFVFSETNLSILTIYGLKNSGPIVLVIM